MKKTKARRIKVTGYITPTTDDRDDDDPTGLTPAGYRKLTKPSAKGAVKVADLEDLSMERE